MMDTFVNILFWLGIVALFDGSFGLLFKEKWQKMAGEFDLQKLALIEVTVAFVLLAAHFTLLFLQGG